MRKDVGANIRFQGQRGVLAVLVASFLLAACAPQQDPALGGAKVQVRGNADNWTGTSNTVVTLTIQKGTGPVSSYTLTGDNSHTWTGSYDRLPVGGDYQFCASATDGGLTFGPTCGPVTISKNQMADVTLILQQSAGQKTINTNSPLISGLVLSDGAPYYGEPITMTVIASDPSAAHALHYLWSATCGDGSATVDTLADETQQTATLTSDCKGTETISITVTDADQGISSVVEYGLQYHAQGANVGVTLNRWPDITSITSPDAQIEPGQRTRVTVVASDADDSTLTYAWTNNCAGTTPVFDAPDMPTTGFLAPAAIPAPYDCTLTVKVSDGKGGSATGSIIVHVGNAVSPTIPVFDNIPAVIPPNLPSQPFQAQQTAEFGDIIALAPSTGRHAVKATVIMSNWAPASQWTGVGDATGFQFSITLNIYGASTDGIHPGALIKSVPQSFVIPWRPEHVAHTCIDPTTTVEDMTGWQASDGGCYHGFAFPITFDLSGLNLTLPDTFAYGIAYNTMTWGYAPIGVDGPYDSLNVGLVGDGKTVSSTLPSIGTDPNPDAVLWNTSTAAWYSDKGAAGVGVFRTDTGWTGYAPAVEFFAY